MNVRKTSPCEVELLSVKVAPPICEYLAAFTASGKLNALVGAILEADSVTCGIWSRAYLGERPG
jgi:hypothetical protein